MNSLPTEENLKKIYLYRHLSHAQCHIPFFRKMVYAGFVRALLTECCMPKRFPN
jgi:hypothetical protein